MQGWAGSSAAARALSRRSPPPNVLSCRCRSRSWGGPGGARGTGACQDAGVTKQRFDLVVRNGTIVTPGHREKADVGVTGGRIAQLGGAMTGAGEIDAAGLLVIPGGIDAHVHLMCAQLTAQVIAAEPGEPAWVDDFWTGSLAAIAGGITTVGNMTFALPGESMTQAVARD